MPFWKIALPSFPVSPESLKLECAEALSSGPTLAMFGARLLHFVSIINS